MWETFRLMGSLSYPVSQQKGKYLKDSVLSKQAFSGMRKNVIPAASYGLLNRLVAIKFEVVHA